MKNLIVFCLIIFHITSFAQQQGTFKDKRNGKVYKTVKIGNQIWMAENLAFKVDSGCLLYDNNVANLKRYGYLYNYQTAKYICPDGWHLPSSMEFESLFDYLGGNDKAYIKLLPTGNSGFNAVFSGWFQHGEGYGFTSGEQDAFYWASNKYNATNSYGVYVGSFFEDANVSDYHIDNYLSVRCLKDIK